MKESNYGKDYHMTYIEQPGESGNTFINHVERLVVSCLDSFNGTPVVPHSLASTFDIHYPENDKFGF